MNCQSIAYNMHAFLDGELNSVESTAIEKHLGSCPHCRAALEELRLIQSVLSGRLEMPEVSEKLLWSSLQKRKHKSWLSSVKNSLDSFPAYWRDLDRRPMWSKLAAIPITLICFGILSMLLPTLDNQEWNFSVVQVSALQLNDGDQQPEIMQASQTQLETTHLMDTVWRIPYEDSLSLVAEIQPDGTAEIGSVLEYPKNLDLLEAIDCNLRNSQFDMVGAISDPVLIYSFQKIDVYEGAGL
jgi:hypothetical protein